MCQIARKPMFYKKKMRALPSTRTAVAQGSHKGAIPLDPRRPPQIDVLGQVKFLCVRENFYL